MQIKRVCLLISVSQDLQLKGKERDAYQKYCISILIEVFIWSYFLKKLKGEYFILNYIVQFSE